MGSIERPQRIVRPGQAIGRATTARQAGRAAGPVRSVRPAVAPQDRYLPRSAELREATLRLDAGLGEAARRELADWLREEYATRHGDVPIGLFSRCYLGRPYVDHRLDIFGVIAEHYTPGDAVPEPYAGARMLVRSGDYIFVEVYRDGQLLPVLDDGTVIRP